MTAFSLEKVKILQGFIFVKSNINFGKIGFCYKFSFEPNSNEITAKVNQYLLLTI